MDKSDKFLSENGKKILKYPGIKKYIYQNIFMCFKTWMNLIIFQEKVSKTSIREAKAERTSWMKGIGKVL